MWSARIMEVTSEEGVSRTPGFDVSQCILSITVPALVCCCLTNSEFVGIITGDARQLQAIEDSHLVSLRLRLCWSSPCADEAWCGLCGFRSRVPWKPNLTLEPQLQQRPTIHSFSVPLRDDNKRIRTMLALPSVQAADQSHGRSSFPRGEAVHPTSIASRPIPQRYCLSQS